MVTSFDWSISKFLENQLHRFQDLKNRKSSNSSLPMDVTSTIITQVTRDSVSGSIGESSVKSSFKKKKVKSDGHNATFRSMLCCFGRPKRKITLTGKPGHDPQNATTNGRRDRTPTPTGVANNSSQNDTATTANGEHKYLLPACPVDLKHKKCAVIDLDETLVHSSFKPISNADFIVPVEIDETVYQVYVLKRPHVDTYLKRMGELYECVLFTASLAKYADPVADLLDKQGVFSSRLFRESCVYHRGNYVKDLSLIGRDLNKVIIVDNSPASYIFHPDNAVPVGSWFDDPNDTELLELLPTLEAIAEADDVYSVLRSNGFTSQAQETTTTIKTRQEHAQAVPAQNPITQQNNNDGSFR